MIDINKKYKTRMGCEVVIFETCEDKIFGKYRVNPTCEWNASIWESNGHHQLGVESCLDLIEISPYEDFKIDDNVLVWNETSTNKVRRHFAGIDESGLPKAWYATGTSFTETSTTTWQNCEKYEEQNDK